MPVEVSDLLAVTPQEEFTPDYYQQLGVYDLIKYGAEILNRANAIDIDGGTMRMRHSNQLDSYYEKRTLEIAAKLMLYTAATVRDFPQINQITGISDWSDLKSHSLDLVVPNKVTDQGREAVAELLTRRIRTWANVQHSPVLVSGIKKMLRDGFSYKLPSGKLTGDSFSRLQAECNRVVGFLLSDIASVDETMTLRTTAELLNPHLVESLRKLRPEVLSEAFNAIIDNVHAVAPIVNRETNAMIDDSLNNIMVLFDNRLQIYHYAVTDDLPSRYLET